MSDEPLVEPRRRAAPPLRRRRGLEAELHEAREIIAAIRSGDVDAIVVQGACESRVYTLDTDDRPYRRLIEQIGEGVLTLSLQGVVLYCNSRTSEMLRRPPEKVVGGRLAELIAPEDRGAFEAMLALGRGRGRVRLLAAESGPLPVYLTLTELGEDGTHTLCGILTGLTELEKAQAELREVTARLLAEIAERERTEALLHQAQKMEAVGQLTGGIAHDFNNMLSLMVGGLEMVERHLPGLASGDAAVRIGRGVSVAMRGAERAASLVQRLLAFSRRQPLNPQSVKVTQLVGGMLDLLQHSLGGTVRLSAELADDVWTVRADPNQLENAILNVAVNARDAMPNGGPLRIATVNRTLAMPGVPGESAGDFVVIIATDGGTGMDQDTLDRAFEPFFTTKPAGAGSGLGLSQVYGFAKQSGGHVSLKSQPGAGTTIEIWLPREQPAPARAAATPAAESATRDRAAM